MNPLEAPATRLGAGSFGYAVPPLGRKAISRQSFVIPGVDYAHYAYLAITEDGTIWQCLFIFYAISQLSMIVFTAFLFALGGFLSSFALLFERRPAAG